MAQQLDDELSSALGDRLPQFEDLASLPFTLMLLQEVLRIYPPAWAVGRMVIADDCIGGYRVPARSFVVLSPYVMHRHPRWWDDPEAFDPSRFSAQRSATRHNLACFPLAAGPRMCVARDFALIEPCLGQPSDPSHDTAWNRACRYA